MDRGIQKSSSGLSKKKGSNSGAVQVFSQSLGSRVLKTRELASCLAVRTPSSDPSRDRKSTRLNSSHATLSRMPSSA